MLNKHLDKLIDEFMDANNNEVSIDETASYFYELGKKDMKEQMGEQARKELGKTDITLADLVAFDEGLKLGRRLERQDMLKDAVEMTVGQIEKTMAGNTFFIHGFEVTEKDFPFINSQECGYGDKVKIVIIPNKEDKE